jgi:Fuc2NAc and GlcNAc transferase
LGTFVRRILRGERIYVAHRNHAYQRLVQSGWSHRKVSSSVFLTNMALAGLATLAVFHPEHLPIVLAVALTGLALMYWSVERVNPFPAPTEQTPRAE